MDNINSSLITENTSVKKAKTRIQAMTDAQDGLCFYCSKPVIVLNRKKAHSEKAYGNFKRATLDHVVPKSQGGGRGKNLVVAHALCNSEKGDTPPTEDMLQRLAELNIKRAYIFDADPRAIKANRAFKKLKLFRFDSFSAPTPSMLTLSHLLNELKGDNGQRLRNRASTIISSVLKDFKTLQIIPRNKREKFVNHVLNDALSHIGEFPEDVQTYLANALKALRGQSLGYTKDF